MFYDYKCLDCGEKWDNGDAPSNSICPQCGSENIIEN
jgi:DNA-directed RNA polymerase subunit RPC12/RpoP